MLLLEGCGCNRSKVANQELAKREEEGREIKRWYNLDMKLLPSTMISVVLLPSTVQRLCDTKDSIYPSNIKPAQHNP